MIMNKKQENAVRVIHNAINKDLKKSGMGGGRYGVLTPLFKAETGLWNVTGSSYRILRFKGKEVSDAIQLEEGHPFYNLDKKFFDYELFNDLVTFEDLKTLKAVINSKEDQELNGVNILFSENDPAVKEVHGKMVKIERDGLKIIFNYNYFKEGLLFYERFNCKFINLNYNSTLRPALFESDHEGVKIEYLLTPIRSNVF